MIIDGNHIMAEEDRHLVRITDGAVFGQSYYLGYTYYIKGILLDEPIYERPEHFIEVDNLEVSNA